MRLNHVERAAANGAGGSEDGNALHGFRVRPRPRNVCCTVLACIRLACSSSVCFSLVCIRARLLPVPLEPNKNLPLAPVVFHPLKPPQFFPLTPPPKSCPHTNP